jgi:hypothetical protein
VVVFIAKIFVDMHQVTEELGAFSLYVSICFCRGSEKENNNCARSLATAFYLVYS